MEDIKQIVEQWKKEIQIKQDDLEVSKLVKTAIGLISKDNANWLYTMRVLNKNGELNGKKLEGDTGNVIMYSYLVWILDQIKETIPSIPIELYLTLDEYLDLARTGSLKKNYKKEGMEYSYIANYPEVTNVQERGFNAYLKKKEEIQKKGGKNPSNNKALKEIFNF